MCFDQEADWYADVIHEHRLASDEDKRCMECGGVIPAGEAYTRIFMQQYEECRVCEWEDGPRCEEDEHVYGETYDYRRCDTCGKLLLAIKESELEAGCREYESQPDSKNSGKHLIFTLTQFATLTRLFRCSLNSLRTFGSSELTKNHQSPKQELPA